MMRRLKHGSATLGLIVILGLVVAACGDASTPPTDLQATTTQASAETTTSTAPPVPTSVPPLDESGPDVAEDSVETTTTVDSTDTSSLDPFGPVAGEEIGVVAVAFDDVLNVRARPGPAEPIVATLDPLARTIATGRHREVADAVWWWEVAVGERTGWAYSAYLSRRGDPVDLSGIDTTLTAVTLDELGRMVVASRLAAFDPDHTVTLVLAPRGEHDLAEVVFDVTGSGDDSVSGMRIHVYARPTDDRQAFQLQRVEVTTMCWRGVTSGVCL
jgi:hypothetical protein